MSPSERQEPRGGTLSERAQAVAQVEPHEVEGMRPDEIRKLVHELQVHQIELELQNEELRRAQLELQDSRDQYADLYDFAPVGYVTLDDQGIIHAANLTAATLLGVDRSCLAGEPLSDFISPQDQDVYHQHRRQMRAGTQPARCEVRLAPTDIGESAVELQTVAFQDAYQRIHGCRTALLDISARKRAAEVLRSNEEKYRAIVENIGIGVALISPNMEILELNRQMRTWFPKVDPDQHPICYRALNCPARDGICEYCPTCKTLQDGQVHEALTETPQEGGIRRYRVVSSAIHDGNGAVVAAIEMVEDVTERMTLQTRLIQAQKMEAVGQLSAGVAHDFNNSLMAILGYTEAARMRLNAGREVGQCLDGIIAVVNQATGVTKGLLTLSRDTPPDVAPVDVGRLIQDSSRMLQRMLPATIEMTAEAAESDELWIRADAVQLNQVLMNVVLNARDAMPDGGRLRIQVLQDPPESADAWTAIATHGLGVVTVVVTDTGAGMPAEVLARVCDPFFTTKPRGRGTGLGMSIVHGIVESHQGQLQVDSEEGRGTRVVVRFPRCEPSIAADAAAFPPAYPNRRGATILVAEDNERVRALIATILESCGYYVLEACDGQQASRLFGERSADIALAILDIDMPRKDGMACMREYRHCRPDVPIIMITGFQDNRSPAAESGEVLLLRKPFSPRKLIRLVGETLAKVPADGN